MRTRYLFWLACAFAVVIALPVGIASAAYGSDLLYWYVMRSGSHNTTYVDDYAADDDNDTFWCSAETGASVNGVSWVGADLGGIYDCCRIRQVGIRQYGGDASVTSVTVQYSDDMYVWYDVMSVLLSGNGDVTQYIDVPDAGRHAKWRVMANSATSGNLWCVRELEMMLMDATETPTPTITPTVTVTPTGSFVELATLPVSGAGYAITREASFGDVASVVLLIVLWLTLIFGFVASKIYGRPNA